MKITPKALRELGFEAIGSGNDQFVYKNNSLIEVFKNDHKEWYYLDPEQQPIFIHNIRGLVAYIYSQGISQGARDIRGMICNALGICPSSLIQ